jgi:anti-anti-sigma factor
MLRELQFQIDHQPPVVIFRLDGAMEPTSFAKLAGPVNQCIRDHHPQIVLDCHRVTYINTFELQELLAFARHARARDGDIKCAGLSPTIRQVAALIAGGDPIECHDAVQAAIAAFQHQTAASHV